MVQGGICWKPAAAKEHRSQHQVRLEQRATVLSRPRRVGPVMVYTKVRPPEQTGSYRATQWLPRLEGGQWIYLIRFGQRVTAIKPFSLRGQTRGRGRQTFLLVQDSPPERYTRVSHAISFLRGGVCLGERQELNPPACTKSDLPIHRNVTKTLWSKAISFRAGCVW